METSSYYWNRNLIKLCETRVFAIEESEMFVVFFAQKKKTWPFREYVETSRSFIWSYNFITATR